MLGLYLGYPQGHPPAIDAEPRTSNRATPFHPPHSRGADLRSKDGQSGITLRISEAVAPDEADFLYRLVSVVIQLTTMIQKSSDPRRQICSQVHHLTPSAKFYVARPDFSLSGERDKYAVRFGNALTVKVPASLVNVEEVSAANEKADTNEVEVNQLTFNSASLLAPLLNQLVQILFQLVHDFRTLPLPTS
jgi:hypothetical protein